MKRTLHSNRQHVSLPRPRRFGPTLFVEPLEERCLLDGRVPLGLLGGPTGRDTIGDQLVPYSVIALGSAMTAIMLFGPPGGNPGPGAPPLGKPPGLLQSDPASPVQPALPSAVIGDLPPLAAPQPAPMVDTPDNLIQDLSLALPLETWSIP